MKARKAVIAAAGLGTRFLPWTKAMPKEMLPLGNAPVIQHIIEGLVHAGVEQIAIVGGPQKRAIEDHFDPSVELERALEKRGKTDKVKIIQDISNLANFVYMGQKGDVQGNLLPMLNAVDAGFISEDQDEPFFYMFADDFFSADVPHAKQLLDTYTATQKSVISLIEVEPEAAEKYGMADISKTDNDDICDVKQLIEKPGIDNRPSDFAAVSGYLLTSDVIPLAQQVKPSSRGEIEITSALDVLAKDNKLVGKVIDGEYHDAGSPTSYAIAVIGYALNDPESEKAIRDYLSHRL